MSIIIKIILSNNYNNIISFRRIGCDGKELICIVNFAPVHHEKYCIGVPFAGKYTEVFTSDATDFGGTVVSNGVVMTKPEKTPLHGCNQSIELEIAPLTTICLKGRARRKRINESEDPAL